MHFHEHHRARRCMGPGFGRGPGGRHGFGGGRHGHGGPFGGRGRRRLFGGDELKLVLLKLIDDAPRHGYDLIREIEALSGEAYAPSPGVVYPTLTLLADMGFIVEQAPDEGGAGGRKLFAVTAAGKAHLLENRDIAMAALERLEALAKTASRTDGAPIRRAMQNLAMAIQSRLEKEGADGDTMFDVASLIDEAAGKIERLK
jgi:DNA-binding PadR family transcriptional regulator